MENYFFLVWIQRESNAENLVKHHETVQYDQGISEDAKTRGKVYMDTAFSVYIYKSTTCVYFLCSFTHFRFIIRFYTF